MEIIRINDFAFAMFFGKSMIVRKNYEGRSKTRKYNRSLITGGRHSFSNKGRTMSLLLFILRLSHLDRIKLVNSKQERFFEIRRKFFHLIGMVFPVATLLFEKRLLLSVLAPITIITMVADYKNWAFFLKKVYRGSLLMVLFREHELVYGRLCGLSWLLAGYLVLICSCDKYLVSMSMTILIICDAVAAVIGKNLGRHKICGSKTLEGSLGFFFSGLFVIAIFLNKIVPSVAFFNVYFLVVALMLATLVELVAKNIMIDDNFAIPVIFGFTYEVLTQIFYNGVW